jgi:RimJ/RimL family protein N-acetyltransferase
MPSCDIPDAASIARRIVVTPRLAVTPCEGAADGLALSRLLSDPQVYARLFAAARAAREPHRAHLPDWHLARRRTDGDAAPPVGALSIARGALAYCVAPDARRQGFADEMLRAACAVLAPAAGVAVLTAQVVIGNEASIRLLEAHGFRFAGRRARRWADAPGQVDVLAYTRRID